MYKNDIDLFLKEEEKFYKDLESSEKNLKLIEEFKDSLPDTFEFENELFGNFDIISTFKPKSVTKTKVKIREIDTRKRNKSNKHLF